MEALLNEMDAKIQTLKFTLGKTQTTIESQNVEALKRHEDSLRQKNRAAHDLKENIEEKKFANKESEEAVSAWSQRIEKVLHEVDQQIVSLHRMIADMEKKEQTAAKVEKEKKEIAMEEAKHKKRMDQQRELIEQQLQFQKTLEANQEMQQTQVKSTATKLPKLSITKFDGKFASWLSFWNKFEAEVDSTALPPVTKFAYLKELVEPKVKTDIDGLPLTSEGYEKAKNILKSEYGKTSEIVNAYVQNILGLPVVTTAHPRGVNQFYKTLLYNVQSLETLGKIERVNGMARSVLDKLEAIKRDLVRGHEDWQEWDLPRLVIALKKKEGQWKDINPCEEGNSGTSNENPPPKRERNKFGLFQADARKCPCVYCDDPTHASHDCTRVPTVDERKKLLAQKRLCFNCTGTKHRAAECKCKKCCLKCGQRHHTSICSGRNQLLISTGEKEGRVVYPVVMVSVEGVLCRALLDTGAGSPYASAAFLAKLSRRTHAKEVRHIEMMLGSTTREVELATITVRSTDGGKS